MSGGNLLNLLKSDEKFKITVNDMMDMAQQSAAGMAYLEELKIVHRDLALRNYFYYFFYHFFIFLFFYLFICLFLIFRFILFFFLIFFLNTL